MDNRNRHPRKQRWTHAAIERGIADGTLRHDARHDRFTAIEGSVSQISSQRFSQEIARYEAAVIAGVTPRPKLRAVILSVERTAEDGPNIYNLTPVVDLYLHLDEV